MTTDAVKESDGTVGSGAVHPLEQSRCQRVDTVASALSEDAERVKRREVEEALGKLDAHGELGDTQRDAVEGMADAIVGQLLTPPLAGIYGAGNSSASHTVARLFELDLEPWADDRTCECGSYRSEVTAGDD